jgi:hypothetical protein
MKGWKHFSREDKRVAIELSKAGVPLKRVRDQLKISEASLRRVLAHAQNNPSDPIAERKKGTGRKSTINQATLSLMKKHLVRVPTLSAKKLKSLIPALKHLAIRQIQRIQKDGCQASPH